MRSLFPKRKAPRPKKVDRLPSTSGALKTMRFPEEQVSNDIQAAHERTLGKLDRWDRRKFQEAVSEAREAFEAFAKAKGIELPAKSYGVFLDGTRKGQDIRELRGAAG